MRSIHLLAACLAVLVLSNTLRADEPRPPSTNDEAEKAPKEPSPALPAGWHGVWKGACTVAGPQRARLEFPMELHVAPIKGRTAWTWQIIYGAGAKRQVRPYELLPVAGSEGHFRVDERNGIIIDAWLHGGTLYSRFEVGTVSIDARYTLRGKRLDVSLVTTQVAPSATTGGKDGVPPVKAFPFVALQSGTLTKSE